MAIAYQYTIFQLVKKSLFALNYATEAIFNSQTNFRTLRILSNVNEKLALLKSDKIKHFNLFNPLSDQYDIVVLPFQEVVEIGLTTNKKYIAAANSQPEQIEEPEEEQIEEDQITVTDNDIIE